MRHFRFDNIAANLATYLRLEASGGISDHMKQTWCEDSNALVGSVTFRPLSHVAEAYSLFCANVGNSPEQSMGSQVQSTADSASASVHRKLYSRMLKSEVGDAEAYVEQRMSVFGFHADPLLANLRRCPSTVPNGHRLLYLRFCFNELPTTRRRHFLNHGLVQNCPFCNCAHGDDVQHWQECECLRNAFGRIYGNAVVNKLFSPRGLMMQCELTGNEVATLMACIHAVWRCRNVITHGCSFADFNDFCTHLTQIVEDPWVHGLVAATGRRERRAERMRPPEAVQNGFVFYSDGASRAPNSDERKGSCGAVLIGSDDVLARLAEYLGDVTNNFAEYTGVLRCLERAVALPQEPLVFRVDSMLVAKQLRGEWACRCPSLRPLYERAVELMQGLSRVRQNVSDVRIQHVYREFNRDADGLANEAIDSFNRLLHRDGVVVDDRWTMSD